MKKTKSRVYYLFVSSLYLFSMFVASVFGFSSVAHADPVVTGDCTRTPNWIVTCTWSDFPHTGKYILGQGEIETGVSGNFITIDGSQYMDCDPDGCSYSIYVFSRTGGDAYMGAIENGGFTYTLAGNGEGQPPIVLVDGDVPPTITSDSSTTVNARDPLNFTVRAIGYPDPSITESGSLPAGVNFTDNGDGTGTLSGQVAPSASGTYPIDFNASNDAGSVDQSFTLNVSNMPSAPSFVSPTSYVANYGGAFNFTVDTTGNPVPAISKTGTLPTGVTFVNNHDGTATIAGTPSGSSNGNYTLNIKAKNNQGTANQTFVLTVTKAPVIKKVPNKTITVGTPFSLGVSASGTETPSLAVVSLPDGLGFTNNGDGTGTISGTTTAGSGGSYTATFTATNSFGTASQNFTIKNNEGPAITGDTSASATVGTPFSFTVNSTGYPAPTVSKTGTLPAGITFHASTDTFSGTPHAGSAGTYPITITAHNSTGTVTQNFVLTVN